MKNTIMLSMFVSILLLVSIAGVIAPGGDPTPKVCGDNILHPSEQCDDGNLINGDGCDENCNLENSQGNTGSIWTTTNGCGEDQQDVNQYAIGAAIYINAANLEPNTNYTWNITGNPGGSSCDPDAIVASGSKITDSSGNICFDTGYIVQNDDCGIYKVAYNGKSDNYRVDPNLPPIPEFNTMIGILTAFGAVGVFFLVRKR